MKNEIFVDTSGWLCFLDRTQPQHPNAKQVFARHLKERGVLVLTSDIFNELLALLSTRTRIARPQILSAIIQLRAMPTLEIVHVTAALHDRAFALLQARPDKNWSWTDAASFLLMRERGINVALTTDHHFEQAGFQRLL